MWRRFLGTVAAEILRWLADKIDAPMATPLTLGITSDVGAVANFLSACIKIGLDINAVINSPQMIQARANVAAEANKDQNAKDADQALSTGKLDDVDKDLS